ncbi:MAG TPA: LysM peptidoglycan-binding domain-containing protein [Firmicutes bacterium]|nr:LysM peptidoglycan-binding domain-containing protein [Bacillota bacterium]
MPQLKMTGNKSPFFRVLYYTDPPLCGPDVAALQNALKLRGYYDGPVSGIYDEKTAEAVQNLQDITGALVTGAVDRTLWRALCLHCTIDAQGRITCAPASVHRAAPGEDLFSIAAAYGHLPQDLQAVNQHITNPSRLASGTAICLPPHPLTGIARYEREEVGPGTLPLVEPLEEGGA